MPKQDSFAKGYRPNPNANGLERYERCNVFGNVEGFIYPEKNAEFFEDLFDLLANKYRICSEEDEDYETIIRLIAWTYQSNNEKFAPIIKEIVEKMYRRAIAGGILKQEHTLCSNLIVSDDDISLYIKAWLKRTNYDISNNKIQVSDWLRSFAGILIYQNNALKNQSSKTCAEVVRNLVEILSYYHKENKEIGIDWALRCFLFILKRRKYDKMFLRQQGDDSKLYNNAVSTLEKIKRSFSNYEFLRSCCLKFLTGNGTLDDFLKGFPKND